MRNESKIGKKKKEDRVSIPLKVLKEELIIPKPSKKGDAGADARIMGFKRIINRDEKKELVDINADSYILKPLEKYQFRFLLFLNFSQNNN